MCVRLQKKNLMGGMWMKFRELKIIAPVASCFASPI